METTPIGPVDFSLFTVPQLQDWLRTRGHGGSGRKEVLVQRAHNVLIQEVAKPKNKPRCTGHVVVKPNDVEAEAAASSSCGPATSVQKPKPKAKGAPKAKQRSSTDCTHPPQAVKNKSNQYGSWWVCGCGVRLSYTVKRTGATTYELGQTNEVLVCGQMNTCGKG